MSYLNIDEKSEDFTYQRTYTGLLDDVMIRYSSEYASPGFFNKMIAKNLFFGGGLYFNDGYLLNHEVARSALANEDSLLRCMLSTGFIHILTRRKTEGELADMPNFMADQGNQSFIDLLSRDDWPNIKKIWHRITYAAFQQNHFRLWPNVDMSHTYTKLIRIAFKKKTDQLGINKLVSNDDWLRIRDDFLERNPQESGPRDKLEKAAVAILTGRNNFNAAMHKVMTIGNQAYHYNFGVTLNSEKKNVSVSVDTIFGESFDELLETREVDYGTLRDLEDIPIMWLPENFPLDYGHIFMPLVDPSTNAYMAKREYFTALRDIVRGNYNDIKLAKQHLADAGRHYRDHLVTLLGPRLGEAHLNDAFENSFTISFGGLSGGALGPDAAAAPVTSGVIFSTDNEAAKRGQEFLIDRFRLRDIDQNFPADDSHVIRLKELRPEISSLAFNKEEAMKFVEDAPKAPGQ
jgi:hypothetical protein